MRNSISILPVRLKLLTLPKETLPGVMHAIVRNLYFRRRDTFFSYTENSLEISIVADVETVEKHFPKPGLPSCPGLVVCEDTFRALQIDSEYGLEDSGERINQLSEPLARAGISIFYLSTYQTDFVFVKEKRLPLVISTLESRDFEFMDLDDLDIDIGTSPISTAAPGMSTTPTFPASYGSVSSCDWATLTLPTGEIFDARLLDKKLVPGGTLRLVGLNREYVESWAMKIIRIIFYPDVIVDGRRGSRVSDPLSPRLFSYTSTEEGISLVADEDVLAQFPDHMIYMSVMPRPLRCIQVDLTAQGVEASGTDRYGIVYSMADPLAASGINLLFLSTFMTSNILVKAQDLPKALMILHVQREGAVTERSPRGSIWGPASTGTAAVVTEVESGQLNLEGDIDWVPTENSDEKSANETRREGQGVEEMERRGQEGGGRDGEEDGNSMGGDENAFLHSYGG
ncbi:Cytosolic arginine sensor for mTORC1 subunit 2 [Borealophlyctis nickersoniae]|nr:Cytosolic arginine sensor for mTORC1 subunit 2 [Borealophlyctis nickersoniae]